MSALWDLSRAQLPVTWDSLAKSSLFGTALLQTQLDFNKFDVFATVASATMESSFNPYVQQYIAKRTALSIIPAGIDYWADQQITITTTGTNETETFPDRIKPLQDTYGRLLKEIAELYPYVIKTIGNVAVKRGPVPVVSSSGKPWRTVDPNLFPAFATWTSWGQLLEWSDWS